MGTGEVFKRWSLLSAGLWVGLVLLVGTGLTYFAERKMLERLTGAHLEYFSHLPYFLLADERLLKPKTPEEYESFDRFVKKNLLAGYVFSIKLYDGRGVLIYHSHDRSLVGRSFPHNPNLERALRGELVLGLSDLQGAEHIYERASGQRQLLEVYLPILDAATSRPIGAYEFYSSVEPLNRQIRQMRLLVWSSVVFGVLLLYLALSLTFRRASGIILERNRALAQQAEDLRRAYEELKRTQAELLHHERLATAGRLASGVVHEIGNPLASILGMVDLLLKCQGTPRQRKECRENLERVAEEIVRLKGILRGLLDYARPTRREKRPLEVNEVVERTLLLLSGQKTFQDIEVKLDLEEPSPWARADAGLLQQVLVNILMNAAQAMTQGGWVSVHTASRAGRNGQGDGVYVGREFPPGEEAAAITIADSGPGVPPETLHRIFEPFFSTQEAGKGAGLGLAICHSIIEELNGGIRAFSQPGEGTTFQILLPSGGLPKDGD